MKIRFFFEKNIDFGEFQHETTKTREGVRFVSFFFFFFVLRVWLYIEVICFVCTVNGICIQYIYICIP